MGIITGSPFYRSCDELFGDRQGTPWSATGRRDYVRKFRVTVKRKDMNALSVSRCPGLPVPGAPYISGNGVEFDLLARLIDYRCREENSDDWQSWIVECIYSTDVPVGGLTTTAQDNPEMEPAEISWDFETVQTALQYDLEGYPFHNSAGLPFSPPPEFDLAYPVLSITRNELDFNAGKAVKYSYALNDESFLGIPRGCAQCLPPSSRKQYRGVIGYWRTSYRIRFSRIRPDGEWISWQPRLLDYGKDRLLKTNEKTGEPLSPSEWKTAPIRGLRGDFLTAPTLLNGDGEEQPYNEDGTKTPVYLDFTVYNYASFMDLFVHGLGQGFQNVIP